jgi:mannitol 2-dehydrogenase
MIDHEVTPLLSEVPGVDLTKYKTTLIERFANLLSFTVPCLFRFLDGWDESGKEMPMLDPLHCGNAQRLRGEMRNNFSTLVNSIA